MDETEIYIKMSDCPEIQALADWRKWRTGYWWNGFKVVVFLVDEMTEKGHPALWFLNPEKCANKAIWLPTQDQIQEMMYEWKIYTPRIWQMYNDFGDFCKIKKPKGVIFQSWEQLWLAFHMHQAYNKIWDGQKWIDQK